MTVWGKDYASKEFLGFGDPLKKAKTEKPKQGNPGRRRFLAALGVSTGTLILLGATIPNPVRSYLFDHAKKTLAEEAIVGKDNDGIYAEFRGNRFKVIREPISLNQGDTLDGRLYALNYRFNQDLRIKGYKLETLQELFHALNGTPNILANLALGETRKFRYNPDITVNLRDGDYHLPVYSSR